MKLSRIIALSLLGGGLWLSNQAATQYLANRWSYPAELGAPLATLHSMPLYAPWSWLEWRERWQGYAAADFSTASLIMMVGAMVAVGAAVLVSRFSTRHEPIGAYGTARWAEKEELEDKGYLGDSGVVLCQTEDAHLKQSLLGGWKTKRPGALIRHDGPEHGIIFAPTRSGKGVGVVVPTLLSWTRSVIVYDMKRENWDLTAHWRSQFSHVLRYEPTSPDSVRFNPLLEIRPAPMDVRDAQNIADILVNPATSDEARDHWKLSGHALLVGTLLHTLYAEDDKSLAGALHFLTEPSRTMEETLHLMLHTHHLSSGPHPVVAAAARAMLNKSDNERSGVMSTAISFLELYRDPVLAENTSSSDFTVSDLMCAERPVSLYLVVPASDADRTKPVMRLILNFVGRRLTERLDVVSDQQGLLPRKHRLLYLIDEFPSLGRIPFFETSLAYLAGFKIKCLLVAQSLNQLDQAYGQNHSLLDNCHVRVTYGANDDRTAKRISSLLGVGSLMRTQHSEGRKAGSLLAGNENRSFQEYGRALKTYDEIMSLPFESALVIAGDVRPYLAKKVMFYSDERFAGRAWNSRTGDNAAPGRARHPSLLPPARGVSPWLRPGGPSTATEASKPPPPQVNDGEKAAQVPSLPPKAPEPKHSAATQPPSTEADLLSDGQEQFAEQSSAESKPADSPAPDAFLRGIAAYDTKGVSV